MNSKIDFPLSEEYLDKVVGGTICRMYEEIKRELIVKMSVFFMNANLLMENGKDEEAIQRGLTLIPFPKDGIRIAHDLGGIKLVSELLNVARIRAFVLTCPRGWIRDSVSERAICILSNGTLSQDEQTKISQIRSALREAGGQDDTTWERTHYVIYRLHQRQADPILVYSRMNKALSYLLINKMLPV